MVCPASDAGDTSLAALMQLAVRLVEVESASDPPAQPYRSLYSARDLLRSVRAQLDSRDADGGRRACVLLYLGQVGLETDELADGQVCLQQCVSVCARRPLDQPVDYSQQDTDSLTPCTVLSCIDALNKLGLLWSQRGEMEKSREVLSLSERAYSAYKQRQDQPAPLLPSQLFGFDDHHVADARAESGALAEPVGCVEKHGWARLEECHTLTLFYLSQVLMSGGECLQSASYLHATLARQLTAGVRRTPERVEWARNAATLSRFYTDQHMFPAARHHLAAADHVLGGAAGGDELTRQCDADVARNWSHLALTLLQVSTDRLLASPPRPTSPPPEQPCFTALDVSAGEALMPAVCVESFEQARPVFLCGQRALERARRYYTLEEHAGDHVELVRQHSRLYKALIFFEADLERQCRMYKRRVALLVPVLERLSVRHFLSVVRQLQYETAEVYSDIAQCKVELQRERDKRHQPVTPHVVHKINLLMRSSIAYFDQFLDTIRVAGKSDGERPLPDVVEDELTRPVLIAYFHLGHLYNRLMETELAPKLANLQRSLAAYRFIVDYCDRVPAAADKMAEELTACREMARLLPARLAQVREAIDSGSTLATQIQYQ